LFGIKRKQTKIPGVQWEIGQVKTGRKGTGEITNNNKKKATYKTAAELAVKKYHASENSNVVNYVKANCVAGFPNI
jgi:hypothetical protein